ncbi:antitoxin Xre/MbcA/ParS toxin-binding domain-containing protein [Pseudomonas peli]|uniref:antitoxin Xre/MbcA/ParS toxin-binding domain-containing protein n=1 Tax=Pseudomonas peli TaxID=592361 RepID=UPI0024ADA446|nr:antitoxin Xre/MbcA/ParS toxin-binding domain-containing protein [Pseudomonas peli]
MDAEIPGEAPIVTAGIMPANKLAISYTFLLVGVSDQSDLSALYRATVSGIRIKALSEFAQSVDMLSSDFLLMKLTGLSGGAIRRRLKSPNERLNSEQSDRALRGVLLLDHAIRVIGSKALAEEWMLNPSRGLDGRKPIDMLENSIGAQLVSDFLTRLEYGVYQ